MMSETPWCWVDVLVVLCYVGEWRGRDLGWMYLCATIPVDRPYQDEFRECMRTIRYYAEDVEDHAWWAFVEPGMNRDAAGGCMYGAMWSQIFGSKMYDFYHRIMGL